jgi:hypothetical protein
MMEEDRDPLLPEYEARKVPTDWQELTPETMAPAFRLWFKALRSPSDHHGVIDPDSEAERLIHDPVPVLREAGVLPDLDEVPRISTMVVNHEKTLKRFIMYATVLVSTNPSTVGITIVKEELPTLE